MYCPNCKNIVLLMTTRQNVEIDYCPNCRGIWLDKGELDKLIELSVQTSPAMNMQNQEYRQIPDHQNHHQARHSNSHNSNHQQHQQPHYNNDNYHHKNKKKEGWFGEIFDFD